jgi:hypothetical protein
MDANLISKTTKQTEFAGFRMMLRVLTVASLASFFSPSLSGWAAGQSSALKFTCPAVKSKKFDTVIQELIEMDLSGARQTSASSCLDQKNFKYIVASHDPPGEGGLQYKPIPEDYTVQILSTKKEDEASYSTRFKVESPGKDFSQEDTLIWMLVQTPERQKKEGCALILQYPSKPLIRKKCEVL